MWLLSSLTFRQDEFVRHFRRLARELEMAIALTYLERWPQAPRNMLALIDRRGEIVLIYAKVHTRDFDVESALTPGESSPRRRWRRRRGRCGSGP